MNIYGFHECHAVTRIRIIAPLIGIQYVVLHPVAEHALNYVESSASEDRTLTGRGLRHPCTDASIIYSKFDYASHR